MMIGFRSCSAELTDLEVQSADLVAFVAGETNLNEGLAVAVVVNPEAPDEHQAGEQAPHATIG